MLDSEDDKIFLKGKQSCLLDTSEEKFKHFFGNLKHRNTIVIQNPTKENSKLVSVLTLLRPQF